jgi:signal peptidase I
MIGNRRPGRISVVRHPKKPQKLDLRRQPTQSATMSETIDPSLPETAAPAKPQKAKDDNFFQFLFKLVIFVTILRSFIGAPFSIPSESMLPKLLVGDYIIVTKFSYGYSKHSLPFSVPLIPGRIFSSLPERGDVAVFKAPPGNHVDYIKRVIGLPGDFVQMREGVLYLNGTAVAKKRIADFVVPVSPNTVCAAPEFQQQVTDGTLRCSYPRFMETLPSGKSYEVLDLNANGPKDNTEIFTVPENHLFMMGDNRDGSADSRYPAMEGGGIGLVPVENLVGKAQFIAFSTDGSASWVLPWTWFSAARGSRMGNGL